MPEFPGKYVAARTSPSSRLYRHLRRTGGGYPFLKDGRGSSEGGRRAPKREVGSRSSQSSCSAFSHQRFWGGRAPAGAWPNLGKLSTDVGALFVNRAKPALRIKINAVAPVALLQHKELRARMKRLNHAFFEQFLETFLSDSQASSSVMTPNRIRSIALTSTGSVQQPPQQPSHKPLRYFVQVDGRWASTFLGEDCMGDTLPRVDNRSQIELPGWPCVQWTLAHRMCEEGGGNYDSF